MKKTIISLLLLMLGLTSMAYDCRVDGIYYNINEDTRTAEVTFYYEDENAGEVYSNYSGSVVIPSSFSHNGKTYTVTSISYQAFNDCTSLTSVTIPNSVTSIGFSAFSGCTGLTSVHVADLAAWCRINFSVFDSNPLYYAHHLYLNGEEITNLTIPNSVTSIGNYAFEYCTGLTSVTIPNSVTSIGSQAFYNCTGLTSVDISNSVTIIGNRAFQYCSGLISVTIPNTVTSIGEYSFSHCSSITSIIIPNSVTSIGGSAFYGCTGLTSVTIPNSVTSIGSQAFYNCTGITEVHISDMSAWCRINFSQGNSNPLYYAHHLYLNGEEVTNLTIPNSVTRIGGYAFYGCTGLTSVTIPNSVTSIGLQAFYGCTGLTSITIPNSVTSISDNAFSSTGITEVHISDMSAWCRINFSQGNSNPLYYAHHLYLNGEEVTNLTIPNSVTSIGGSAFYGCTGLTSVTIPNSVTSIGSQAFYNCTGLTSITIPNSVTSIGSSAFYGCTNLSEVIVEKTTPYSLSNYTFYNAYSATLYVPGDAVTAYQAATNWKNFSSIQPISLTLNRNSLEMKVGSQASMYDSYYKLIVAFTPASYTSEISWESSNPSVARVDQSGGVYSVGVGTATITASLPCGVSATCNVSVSVDINYYINEDGISVTVSDDTHYKGDIVIPSSVTYNGTTYSVTSIGSNAFSNRTGLTSVTIPNTVTSIGDNAFHGCTGLTSVTIPNSVTSIGVSAFGDCENLTSVSIPNTVTSIGLQAFADCYALTSIAIPSSITSIENGVFRYCTSLTSVTIPNSVTSIGEDAFMGCSSLTSVNIPNTVTSIDKEAFYGCSGLTALTIPNSVTTIANSAFSSCSDLISVTIPNSVTSIGEYAFYNCVDLTSVIIPNSVMSISSHAFDFYNLTDMDIIVERTSPCTITDNTFTYCFRKKLYVPSEAVEAYSTATYWSSFSSILPISLTLDQTSIERNAGDTQALVATVVPASYASRLTWESNDAAVATVSSDGTVTAVGAGTATITVSLPSGATATCAVTVIPTGTDIALNGNITSETITALNDFFTNNEVNSVDLTGATSIADGITIPVSGNCIIYVPSGTTLGNTQNVVENGVCDNLVVSDGQTFEPTTAFTATNATYSRTNLSNAWGTVCLPYEVSSDENVTYYTGGTISGDVLTLTSAETLPAGTPAIYKSHSESGGKYSLNATSTSVSVVTAVQSESVTTDDITLVGSFTEQVVSGAAGNVYAIANNQFWQVGSTVTIKPFRAYFTTSGAHSNKFSIVANDDDVTAIAALAGESDTTIVAIYAADGKQISDLQKGLNIVKLSNGNTKKIILN